MSIEAIECLLRLSRAYLEAIEGLLRGYRRSIEAIEGLDSRQFRQANQRIVSLLPLIADVSSVRDINMVHLDQSVDSNDYPMIWSQLRSSALITTSMGDRLDIRSRRLSSKGLVDSCVRLMSIYVDSCRFMSIISIHVDYFDSF